MKVMSYNSLFGGWDAGDDRRHRLQVEVVRSAAPDILFFQEAKHFDAAGGRRLYDAERAFGMRAFLAVAPNTGQHTAIFLRPDIEPITFEPDAIHFHHAAAILTVRMPRDERPIALASVHLCPLSPHVRLTEIAHLLHFATPDRLALVAGDFNSVGPHDIEPSDWGSLPLHHRSRYLSPDGQTADRSVLRALYGAGFADIGRRLDSGGTPTVPAASFKNTEFVPFRSDYFLASLALAERAASYAVLRNKDTDLASDHYPIVAEFAL